MKEKLTQEQLMEKLNKTTEQLHAIIFDLFMDKPKPTKVGESDMYYNHIITNNLGHQVLLKMQITMPTEEIRIRVENVNNKKEK